MSVSADDTQDLAVLTLQLNAAKKLYGAEIGRLDATKKRVNQTFFVFGMLSCMVGSLVAWILIQQYRFRKQFGVLIDVIDGARASGKYYGPSGVGTIWAYEYGRMGALFAGFSSPDLAVAIVDSFYDINMNKVFLGTDNGINALMSMREISQRGDYSANQIMCAALFPGDNEPTKCMPNCNVSGATTAAGTAAAYLGAAVSGVGLGVGGGMTAFNVVKSVIGGPVAMGIGAVVGLAAMGASMATTHMDLKRRSQQCQQSLQGCVNVAGVSC